MTLLGHPLANLRLAEEFRGLHVHRFRLRLGPRIAGAPCFGLVAAVADVGRNDGFLLWIERWHYCVTKSAIVPIPPVPLRIGPIPAQVGMWTRWDGTNGGNGDESTERHTSNDSAVVGAPHPWTAIPIRSASRTGGATPSGRSSPTGLTTPAGVGAGTGIYVRARSGVGAGSPRLVGGILDCYGFARLAGGSVLGYVSGSSCLTS